MGIDKQEGNITDIPEVTQEIAASNTDLYKLRTRKQCQIKIFMGKNKSQI